MFERNGNDASIVAHQVTGFVVHFKHDYGFIRPDDKSFDDLFFHVRDVEPWREGFKHITGRQQERVIDKPDGSTTVIPHFPGEKVKFDIKESGKTIQTKNGPKKGFKAVNIEMLTEFEGSNVIEGKENNERKI